MTKTVRALHSAWVATTESEEPYHLECLLKFERSQHACRNSLVQRGGVRTRLLQKQLPC